MANGGFLLTLQTYIDEITLLTGSSEHDINRLIGGVPSESCLISPDTGVAEIKVKFTGAVNIQALSVVNHSIPADAIMKVYFSTDGSDWTNETAVAHNAINLYKIFDYTKQYIKLRVETTSDFQVGELFSGAKFQFPENWDYDYVPGFRIHKVAEQINGQYRQKEISRQRKWSLPFKRQSIDDWETFANLHDAEPKIFVPDFGLPDCFHVAIPGSDFDPKRSTGDVDTFTIEAFENAVKNNVQG